MEFSDEQLVTSARNGDSSAYATLFQKHQGGIYNFAYSITRSTEDARDIAQESFIKVFEALPGLKEKAKFSSYLYRTARNLAMDELKKQKRFGSADVLDLEKDKHIDSDPQRSLLLQEQQREVRETAASLGDDYRMVLALRELQDLSYEEISSVMEIPKNSVGVLLLRARLKFKQEFRMSQVDVEQLSKECKEMLPLLSAFVDNELSQEEREKVEEHLKDCPLCRLALEEMTEASKSYRGIIPLIPPPNLQANVFARIRSQIEGQFKAPESTSGDTPGLKSGTSEKSGMEITQKMEPIQKTTSSGEIPESGTITKKGIRAKLAGLSAGKKALIISIAVSMGILIIGGGTLAALAGINSLQSQLKLEDTNLSPYGHELPAELMEQVPEIEEGIMTEEVEPDYDEESTEVDEDGGRSGSSGESDSEDEQEEEVAPDPSDESPDPDPRQDDTETPETSPDPNDGGRSPQSDPQEEETEGIGQDQQPNLPSMPMFPELKPLDTLY